jgi:hypothetical protein
MASKDPEPSQTTQARTSKVIMTPTYETAVDCEIGRGRES